MDNLYLKGEMLRVHTKNHDVIEGQFYGMTVDKSKISLYNVKELPQGIKNEGILHYYDTEIQDIVKLKSPDVQTRMRISMKECEEIIKVSKKYNYINQVDNAFHEALNDLKEQSYIALGTDGAIMGRKCKIPFLVMSSPEHIYIFDIAVMQYRAFDAGLKSILEDKDIKKIVHDCRKISDCLYHKHNVKLTSVFDTQVGDLIIERNKCGMLPRTVKSLSECLNIYLGLQKNAVNDQYDMVQYNSRPLTTQIKESLAKNICFIHRLSEAIHEEMMLPFVRGVECYIDNIRICDDFKAWELCGKEKQIPKDFKNAIEY